MRVHAALLLCEAVLLSIPLHLVTSAPLTSTSKPLHSPQNISNSTSSENGIIEDQQVYSKPQESRSVPLPRRDVTLPPIQITDSDDKISVYRSLSDAFLNTRRDKERNASYPKVVKRSENYLIRMNNTDLEGTVKADKNGAYIPSSPSRTPIRTPPSHSVQFFELATSMNTNYLSKHFNSPISSKNIITNPTLTHSSLMSTPLPKDTFTPTPKHTTPSPTLSKPSHYLPAHTTSFNHRDPSVKQRSQSLKYKFTVTLPHSSSTHPVPNILPPHISHVSATSKQVNTSNNYPNFISSKYLQKFASNHISSPVNETSSNNHFFWSWEAAIIIGMSLWWVVVLTILAFLTRTTLGLRISTAICPSLNPLVEEEEESQAGEGFFVIDGSPGMRRSSTEGLLNNNSVDDDWAEELKQKENLGTLPSEEDINERQNTRQEASTMHGDITDTLCEEESQVTKTVQVREGEEDLVDDMQSSSNCVSFPSNLNTSLSQSLSSNLEHLPPVLRKLSLIQEETTHSVT